MEGYIKKRPDVNWWLEQINAGKEFRKKYAHEASWDRWRAYYRGNWSGDVLPVNLFFTLMRTVVPRVYFRNPSISIGPAKPGLVNMGFARILERIDNKLMRQMGMKKQIKRGVQAAFMFGTGFSKVGFGGFYAPTPSPESTMFDKKGSLVEYRERTFPNMPWFSNLHPGSVIVPDGLMDYNTSRWVVHEIRRPLDDIRADQRFDNTTGLKSTSSDSFKPGDRMHEKNGLLYEVRDAKTQTVFVIAPDKDGDKVIFFGHDDLQDKGFPIRPLIFNEDDEFFWGVPDSQILEPYQLEINEIKTQMMKHRRIAIVKILVRERGMSTEDAEKLVSEDVAAVAFVRGDPRAIVQTMQASSIPIDLFRAAEAIVQDVRESIGFSRNQFGEFNSQSGDTTATEANIVRQASEIRVDERRDMIADMIVEVMETIHQIIFKFWTEDTVVDVVGPGGAPIWVRLAPSLLKEGRYNIKVDPDTSVPETRALREQKAVQVYQLLKTNPLIDPVQLTQYLLHEMHGVQFDDMMRMLPAVEGPSGEVGIDGFAGLIGQSVNKLNNGAAPNPPQTSAGGNGAAV